MKSAENQKAWFTENLRFGDSHEAEAGEDACLLSAVAEGNQDALAALYRRRGGLLYSLAVRMLANEMEAQELMQDLFVQIWRRAREYDSRRSSPVTWIIMIERGLAVDRLRARSRRTANYARYEQEVASLEVELSSSREIERNELHSACAAALNDLPPSQARALQLAFLRGWTHEEIARSLGEPLGTVKARIRRGLLELRKILKDHHV